MSTDQELARFEKLWGVALKRLAPIDEGDECRFCHKMEATVEDTETGDRYCGADCAEEDASNRAEALEQRNLERFYGG